MPWKRARPGWVESGDCCPAGSLCCTDSCPRSGRPLVWKVWLVVPLPRAPWLQESELRGAQARPPPTVRRTLSPGAGLWRGSSSPVPRGGADLSPSLPPYPSAPEAGRLASVLVALSWRGSGALPLGGQALRASRERKRSSVLTWGRVGLCPGSWCCQKIRSRTASEEPQGDCPAVGKPRPGPWLPPEAAPSHLLRPQPSFRELSHQGH